MKTTNELLGPVFQATHVRLTNPLDAQLTHRPFPQLAEALRGSIDDVTRAWTATVREAIPRMAGLSFDELKDSTPNILAAIADAMASGDRDAIRGVISHSPLQGRSRFLLNLDVVDILQEDRLLRAITVQHVEAKLGRQMDVLESAALQAAIDVMVQQSVIAIVNEQKRKLREAAETELKYLAFLNHDLNNNLAGVSLCLDLVANELTVTGDESLQESLALARSAIHDTIGGMRQMLNRARLQKSGQRPPAMLPIELRALASTVAGRFTLDARRRGIAIMVEVQPGIVVKTDPELLTLILQNLIGNAVKYSSSGTVTIGCDSPAPAAATPTRASTWPESGVPCVLWVSDQGPGIAPELCARIFDAFHRGEAHGQHGIGLGLTIASEAARLLGAELTVESELAHGSTFRLALRTSNE